MSNCVFIAADVPLAEHSPSENHPVSVNLDTGVVDDGGADDRFYLLRFSETDIYSCKKYGVTVELDRFTQGRAKEMIAYLGGALRHTDSVELWNVWLLGYWEYEDRPIIHTETVPVGSLSASDIQRLINHRNWEETDPDRAHFYCMKIIP